MLNLEGLWTRYENPEPVLEEIAHLQAKEVSPENTRRLQEIYSEPIKAELIKARLAEIREAGVVVSGSLTPQRTQEFYQTVVDAGVDMFVIRGTTVSAEHVAQQGEPLNLKEFIYELDVPVIVGGPWGSASRWPLPSQILQLHAVTTWMSPVAAMSMSSPTAGWAAPGTS